MSQPKLSPQQKIQAMEEANQKCAEIILRKHPIDEGSLEVEWARSVLLRARREKT